MVLTQATSIQELTIPEWNKFYLAGMHFGHSSKLYWPELFTDEDCGGMALFSCSRFDIGHEQARMGIQAGPRFSPP
jgi:hypothetical protein